MRQSSGVVEVGIPGNARSATKSLMFVACVMKFARVRLSPHCLSICTSSASPPKTVEQVRKLVESDEVFTTFQIIGTPPNAAVQKYLNAAASCLDWRRNESRPRLIISAKAEMSDHQREIYHSENGDRWLLCRDDNGRGFVTQANVSSGGMATEIELGNFLGRGKSGPEHQALARLIGSLVNKD